MITAEEAKKRTEIAKKKGIQNDMKKIECHLQQVEEYILKESDKGKNAVVVSLPDCDFLLVEEYQQIIIEHFTKRHFSIKFPRSFRYIVSW